MFMGYAGVRCKPVLWFQVIGFLTLVVWTLVWIVAAEAGEKPKTLVGRNPLGFQRL